MKEVFIDYNKLKPKPEELSAIRHGAEMAQMKPYLDTEIVAMQKAVISSVLAAVNNGNLTAEMALSKWMEYIAYYKLNQKIEQRINIGASIGGKRDLDFNH